MSNFVYDKRPTIGTKDVPGESWDMYILRTLKEERSKKMSWGYHLTVDCKSCNRDKIKNADNIRNFAKALVKNIDMVAYGEPQVVHFGSEDKTGYTLVQLIETSNICAHFCDDSGDSYFDVFSCKPFANDIVVDTIKEYFEPEEEKANFFNRQA